MKPLVFAALFMTLAVAARRVLAVLVAEHDTQRASANSALAEQDARAARGGAEFGAAGAGPQDVASVPARGRPRVSPAMTAGGPTLASP